MAAEADVLIDDWGGGVHPYRVGHRKLGMWLFIMSDSLTFSALLIGYAYLRASNVWPTPFKFYPSIVFSSVMTLVLLTQYLDTLKEIGASANTNTLMLSHAPSEIHSLRDQISQSIAVGDLLSENVGHTK